MHITGDFIILTEQGMIYITVKNNGLLAIGNILFREYNVCAISVLLSD